MTDILLKPVLISMCRTAVGSMGGTLSNTSAIELATLVLDNVMSKSDFEKDIVEEVVLGNVENRADESCTARWASQRAGYPLSCGGSNVNILCGSGMKAIHNISESIMVGRINVGVAAGVENMSRYPHIIDKARFGYRLAHGHFQDTLLQTLADNMDSQRRPAANMAENLAKKYNITREEQDVFALESQRRAAVAVKEKFHEEIIPVEVEVLRKGTVLFEQDEYVRLDTSLEKLSKLSPIMGPDGTVTAGNACGINDGASAMLIMSEHMANSIGAKPLARIMSFALGCNEPHLFGVAPVYAIRKILENTGLKLDDIGLFDINEAFAAQVIACERELGLNRDILNVNGGAIALGHALGNSGIRVSITLLHEMFRRNVKYGISALCIGTGQGVATLWENMCLDNPN